MRLGPAKRTQTLVRPMPHQGLETEPDRVGICLRSRRRLGVAQEALVDMKCLLHTDDYAINVWPYVTSRQMPINAMRTPRQIESLWRDTAPKRLRALITRTDDGVVNGPLADKQVAGTYRLRLSRI